ncbi:zinc ribbon domain-containing protein [bacterium]|nr:MAG: zinc ribbon domain-containing protein [bacterium]
MPTYVYRCSECDLVFEAFQRITEDALTDCPNGHHNTVKRVIQPVGIAFSGSGFHINDYASSPAPSEGSSESSSGGGSEAKSSSGDA